MQDDVVLRATAKALMPFMMVFGLYVIFHGESGPGGGFQGGVILAVSFILFGVVYGVERLEQIAPKRLVDVLTAVGVLIYVGVGVFGLVAGDAFLDYEALKPSDPQSARAWGMTLVEIGVGITVAAVMITLYREFAEP